MMIFAVALQNAYAVSKNILKKKSKLSPTTFPIGSMYAIYGNIYHQYTPNVGIYTIHGSYGVVIIMIMIAMIIVIIVTIKIAVMIFYCYSYDNLFLLLDITFCSDYCF
jgi:hypothetical protein